MRLVPQCQRKRHPRRAKALDFPYAIRSFIGYLEGTEKSAHTIKNYRGDLTSFQRFLEKGLGSAPVGLSRVNREDLERYHDYLKAQGLKNNTRRRKILTVRKLLQYLTQRNKLTLDVGRKLPAPHKIERIPVTVGSVELVRAIRALAVDNGLQARNRVLFWTLAETGCLVSEATRLRFEYFSPTALAIPGKSPRDVPISEALYAAVQELKAGAGDKPWLFFGFNKFGSLGSPISPRGVELLVKAYAHRLGLPELTPRTFRHSAVLYWFEQGLKQDEIQKRLGLKTAYAFRVFAPLLSARAAL